MGVFADWAEKYFDLGINVIPIGSEKRPPKGCSFKKWLTEKQTEKDIEFLIKSYGDAPGIAVICGAVSGIVGFDYDYKFSPKMPEELNEKKWKADYLSIESEFRKFLPDWSLAKKAKHGWTSFYKYNPSHYTITADRNKVRLFDFKASGYIVIPPSFHSFDKEDNSQIYFSWIVGDPMDDFLSLPDLDISIVKDFKTAFETRSMGESSVGGRHGAIFKFACDLVKVEENDAIVAQRMIDFDAKINCRDKKGSYFLDKTHVSSDPFRYAKSWASRIRSFVSSKGFKSVEKPGSYAWDHFFESSFFDVRKDVLSRRLFCKKSAADSWVLADAMVDVLKSYAKRLRMPKGDVKEELARYAYEREKVDFLCDLPKWDGVNRVREFTDRLVSDYFSSDEVYSIVMRWGVRAFGRVDSSFNQNECLILNGKQNMGKDTWIRQLLGGFDPYYSMISPPSNPKDWLEILSSLYIVHIEEFDQTASVNIAFLKQIITQPSTYFRESYGISPTKKTTAVNFISSANPNDFFRDTTGNRRFVVLPLSDIKWGPKVSHAAERERSLQCLAQFKASYEAGRMFDDAVLQGRITALNESMTPESSEDFAKQLWEERAGDRLKYLRDSGTDYKGHFTQSEAAPILAEISKHSGLSERRVRSLLKNSGYQLQVGSQRERLWCPTPNKEMTH